MSVTGSLRQRILTVAVVVVGWLAVVATSESPPTLQLEEVTGVTEFGEDNAPVRVKTQLDFDTPTALDRATVTARVHYMWPEEVGNVSVYWATSTGAQAEHDRFTKFVTCYDCSGRSTLIFKSVPPHQPVIIHWTLEPRITLEENEDLDLGPSNATFSVEEPESFGGVPQRIQIGRLPSTDSQPSWAYQASGTLVFDELDEAIEGFYLGASTHPPNNPIAFQVDDGRTTTLLPEDGALFIDRAEACDALMCELQVMSGLRPFFRGETELSVIPWPEGEVSVELTDEELHSMPAAPLEPLDETRRLRPGARPLLVMVERTEALRQWPDPIAVLHFSIEEPPPRVRFVNSYGSQVSLTREGDDGAVLVPLVCRDDVCTGELEVQGVADVSHDLSWEVSGEVYHPGIGDNAPLKLRLRGGGD